MSPIYAVPIVIALLLFAIYCVRRVLAYTAAHRAAVEERRARAATWPLRITIPHGEVVVFRDGGVFVREWGRWYVVFSPAPLVVEVL